MLNRLSIFAASFCLITYTLTSYATEPNFKDTQTLLTGESVQHFVLNDLDGDHRLDIIWQTHDGDVKYKLQDNQALVNFDSLAGTKWLLRYDNDDNDKYIDFFNDGGVIETYSGSQYKINRITVTELNQLEFCSDDYSGLHRTDCKWIYRVTEILPNMMKGIDERLGEAWTAYKLVAGS
ncbi:hypothetical protein [uncultured Shewanella sp.]|uniref:hypothetical protein n=1 Tax=uncultured Shewanella sp. TaxID=173975 RepID=UPI00260F0B72|nr:hypothetical protein [uncultured Shewanella sp.]